MVMKIGKRINHRRRVVASLPEDKIKYPILIRRKSNCNGSYPIVLQ